MAKRIYKKTLKGYEITVRDYGYKSRAPVAVRVSGTRLGECVNPLGEPCYFYESLDAFSVEEGIKLAREVVNKRPAPKNIPNVTPGK